MSNQRTLSHAFDVLTNSTSRTQYSFDHESLSIVFRMLADEHRVRVRVRVRERVRVRACTCTGACMHMRARVCV